MTPIAARIAARKARSTPVSTRVTTEDDNSVTQNQETGDLEAAGEVLDLGDGGGAATPDASAGTKGKLQLAGALGGTAAAPTALGYANAAALATALSGKASTASVTQLDTDLTALETDVDGLGDVVATLPTEAEVDSKISTAISDLPTNSEVDNKITAALDAFESGGETSPIDVAFSTSIPLDNNGRGKKMARKIVDSAVTLTPSATSPVDEASCSLVVAFAGGSLDITAFSDAEIEDQTEGKRYSLIFARLDGTPVLYSLTELPDLDLSKPTLISATIENANPDVIVTVWSEAVPTHPLTSDVTLGAAGGRTVTGVSGTGDVINFTVDADFEFGDTPTIAFAASSVGDTEGNLCDAVSATAIDNNVEIVIDGLTLRGAVGQGYSGDSIIALPDGSAVGDRAYLLVYGGHATTTLAGLSVVYTGTDSIGQPYSIFAKTLDSDDITAGAISHEGSADVHICWVITGSASNAEEDFKQANYTNNATTSNVPSSTSTVDESWHVIAFGDNQHNDNTAATPPAGYNLLTSLAIGAGTVFVYYKEISPAGATGTPNLIWTQGGCYGFAAGFIVKA